MICSNCDGLINLYETYFMVNNGKIYCSEHCCSQSFNGMYSSDELEQTTDELMRIK